MLKQLFKVLLVLKNALNGDQNVTNAKNTAKHALNNLTSINNAQKNVT